MIKLRPPLGARLVGQAQINRIIVRLGGGFRVVVYVENFHSFRLAQSSLFVPSSCGEFAAVDRLRRLTVFRRLLRQRLYSGSHRCGDGFHLVVAQARMHGHRQHFPRGFLRRREALPAVPELRVVRLLVQGDGINDGAVDAPFTQLSANASRFGCRTVYW